MVRGILISGRMLSGKDHVARHIASRLAGDYSVHRMSWAYALKAEVAALVSMMLMREVTVEDIERDKVRYRPLLQVWGRFRRDEFPGYWVRRGLENVQNEEWKNLTTGRPSTFTVNADTRYPNELDVKRSGFIAIRLKVDRGNQLARMRHRDGASDDSVLDHDSETAMDGIEALGPGPGTDRFDYILEDMSLDDLYAEIDRILEERGLLPTVRGAEAGV